MYFWNIKKLKTELIARPLPEKESLKYLLAIIILSFLPIFPLVERNIWDIYSNISLGLVYIIGVINLYRCNGGNSGNNFLQKCVSLGWVVLIRYIALVVPIGILIYALIEYNVGVPDETTSYDVLFSILIYIIYFYILAKHFKDVASQNWKKIS